MTWFSGVTADGEVTIRIENDPYVTPCNVYVREAGSRLGERAIRVWKVSRLRDGGTTIIKTELGDLVIPNRLGQPPERNIPTLDGEPIQKR